LQFPSFNLLPKAETGELLHFMQQWMRATLLLSSVSIVKARYFLTARCTATQDNRTCTFCPISRPIVVQTESSDSAWHLISAAKRSHCSSAVTSLPSLPPKQLLTLSQQASPTTINSTVKSLDLTPPSSSAMTSSLATYDDQRRQYQERWKRSKRTKKQKRRKEMEEREETISKTSRKEAAEKRDQEEPSFGTNVSTAADTTHFEQHEENDIVLSSFSDSPSFSSSPCLSSDDEEDM
jgi:hypothetical protein